MRTLASLADEQAMKEAYFTGRDLYATMASQIYKMPYEDCMEFYLDENGKKTTKTNPEGKKRRSATKGILLGIMYGRGTASVAEQIHSTVEEAQKIIDDFFVAYPNIKQFVEEKQQEAHKRGFTETAWGRRRYIKHVTDSKFEYKYNNNRPIDFNPLFTAKSIFTKEVSDEIKEEYNQKLESVNRYQRTKIIEQARKDGIDIIDNSGFIAEANRQVVNSIIQGSASDITKIAMIKIGQNEELKKLGYKMLFPVHDEIIAECPFENRKRCGELMSQLMIDAAKEHVDVPMKCDVEAFTVWYGDDVDMDDTEEALRIHNEYDSQF